MVANSLLQSHASGSVKPFKAVFGSLEPNTGMAARSQLQYVLVLVQV